MKGGQRGSTSFLMVAMVLPLVFLLFSLSVDLERYFTEIGRIQKALDDTALYAQRFLPHVTRAEQAARGYLARFEGVLPLTALDISADKIRLVAEKQQQLTFPQIVGVRASLPLKVASEAWSSPFDVLIGFDSGSYLGPQAQVEAEAWGDELDWPSADLFRNFLPRFQDGGQIDPRIITQQCFNPIFSELKRAAIRTYDYFAASKLNAVAVEVFPATSGEVWEIRELDRAGARADGRGEADFDQLSRSTHAQDSWCAAASEREISSSKYLFPDRSPGIARQWYPELDPARPDTMVQDGTWEFDPSYQPWLETRQAIWARAIQSRITDISAILASVRDRLIGGPQVHQRMSLAQLGTKSAVFFLGDLPWQQGRRFPNQIVKEALSSEIARTQELIELYGMRLRIYLVIAQHFNLPPGSGELISELAQFIDQELTRQGGGEALQFRVISDTQLDTLYGAVVSQLLLERQTGVLAR